MTLLNMSHIANPLLLINQRNI